MDHNKDIGFQVRTLSHLIKRMVDKNAFGEDGRNPTGTHGWVMEYLYSHRDRDIFQRDIQKHFSIRRSTVTGILQLMEKNGLITRTSVAEDARLKKIQLTPAAVAEHERVMQSIQKVEERVSTGLTPEEKKTFLELCEKMRSNVE